MGWLGGGGVGTRLRVLVRSQNPFVRTHVFLVKARILNLNLSGRGGEAKHGG